MDMGRLKMTAGDLDEAMEPGPPECAVEAAKGGLGFRVEGCRELGFRVYWFIGLQG